MRRNLSALILGGCLVLSIALYVYGAHFRNQPHYQLRFAPQNSQVLGSVFIIDTASGNVWSYCLKDKTFGQDGQVSSETWYWREENYKGLGRNLLNFKN